MGNIYVAGSINMDIVTKMENLPRPGETVFAQELHYIPGGKGSNQAVAASRLGEHVYLIGKLGNDPFGQSLTEFLGQEQLNLDYLFYTDSAPTGIALINVDGRSENSIVVVSGSNFHLSVNDVDQINLQENDVVVSVFEIPQPTIKHLFHKAKQAQAKTILTPAPATPFIDGLLELVDYLILNETELAFFCNQDQINQDPEAIAANAQQLRHHDEQTIIVTLGAKGAIAVHGDTMLQIEGIAVKAVDTTGAGDCFAGAFAVAVAEGMSLQDAVSFANTAASISVQHLGASTSMPTRQTVVTNLA